MSKTDNEQLDLLERDPYCYAPGSQTLESLVQYLIAEMRRQRAENAELKKKVALLTSDKRDLIEEIEGPVEEYW